MSIQDAEKFLRRVQEDSNFREALLKLTENLPDRLRLIKATRDGFPDDTTDEEIRAYALPVKKLITGEGYNFTREELYSAAGGEPPELSNEDEKRLRVLDAKLRERGLEATNPYLYTAYSLGFGVAVPDPDR